MSKIAFIFPGQGAQKTGMGKDFYEKSKQAKQIYDLASELLELDMPALCFEQNDRLDQTEYTQAALVTTSLAITAVAADRGLAPVVTAGLSLGEYCAIAVAGGMSYKDAIVTVRRRGILMHNAIPPGVGTMKAVLGLKAQVVEEVLNKMRDVSIANYNCPGQIVITGLSEAVEEAGARLLEAGAKRVLPLDVSGPFHSPLLTAAGVKLKEVLNTVEIKPLTIPYVSNVTGTYVTDSSQIRDLLGAQVAASVRWQQSIEVMLLNGVDTFVEIGPGKTLTGFLKRISPGVKAYNIETWEDMEHVMGELVC